MNNENQNENKEEVVEKKSKNKLILIIVILAVIVAGLSTYILYEKNIIFTNKEPVNIDKKKDSDTKDDENKQDENGCVVCDSEGGICCPVSGE